MRKSLGGAAGGLVLSLSDTVWSELRHAYGAAGDVPGLLSRAATDPRPGHHPESAWFALWSALCHQGDAYSASLAAVPHLIATAPEALARHSYEPLLLAASIEQARLEGRAPTVPPGLASAYTAAIETGRELAERAAPEAWNSDAQVALSGSLAVFRGDLAGAQAIFEADLESET
jgi:hypothetical protein